MGWIGSPPYLSTITKTIADLTNARLAMVDLDHGSHHLDKLVDLAPPSPSDEILDVVILPQDVLPLPGTRSGAYYEPPRRKWMCTWTTLLP